MKKPLASRSALLFAAGLSMGALGSVSRAGTYAETSDAGQTLATAQSTASSSAAAGATLTEITGSIFQPTDADLYVIQISNAGTFSATTNNSATSTGQTAGSNNPGNALDTELFLLNASGQAIAVNDNDPSGTTVTSTLPAGNSLYATLSPGTYYLGVAISTDEPVNENNDLLYAADPGGDTTAVRGPSGTTPTTLANFDSSNVANEFGNYEIDLAGAATGFNPVPEPSAWVLTALGSLALCTLALRRRAGRI